MRRAIRLARYAEHTGEVPIAAVVVQDGRIISAATNSPITSCDPTAHAEIVAMRRAARQLKNYRLPGTVLYVTLEPCAMCAGAMVQARIARLVFGAFDPRAGAAGSVFDVFRERRLNHRVAVTYGCEGDPSAALLRNFFREKRLKKDDPFTPQ